MRFGYGKKKLLWHNVLRFRTNEKGSVMGRFNAPESIIHNPTVDADRSGASKIRHPICGCSFQAIHA